MKFRFVMALLGTCFSLTASFAAHAQIATPKDVNPKLNTQNITAIPKAINKQELPSVDLSSPLTLRKLELSARCAASQSAFVDVAVAFNPALPYRPRAGKNISVFGCFRDGKSYRVSANYLFPSMEDFKDENGEFRYSDAKRISNNLRSTSLTIKSENVSWDDTELKFVLPRISNRFGKPLAVRISISEATTGKVRTIKNNLCVGGYYTTEPDFLAGKFKHCANDFDGDGAIDAFHGGSDCADNNPQRYGGNTEYADDRSFDEDCNLSTVGFVDEDLDGYQPDTLCNEQNGFKICGKDCDDNDPIIYRNQIDVFNGRDDNCNGLIDENQTATDIKRLLGIE